MQDFEHLLSLQLSASTACEKVFQDGRKTSVVPVRLVPFLADFGRSLSLQGRWRVQRNPFPHPEEQLASARVVDDTWDEVEQPGKVFYADPETPPGSIPQWDRRTMQHLHADDGAVLRRTVTIPADWQGKRVLLRFDAIYPGGRVYLNGKLLGEQLSGLTPIEWDVTGLVEAGADATVAVRILRKHGLYNELDMPRHSLEFAGLAQDACLHAVESCHVSDYHLWPALDAAYRVGRLSGTVQVRNAGTAECRGRLAVMLKNPRTGQAVRTSAEVCLAAGSLAEVPVALDAGPVDLWNAERPNLYDAVVSLEIEGQPVQTVRYQTGFRSFELRNERPWLNGQPVKFRGVNHLTFHPEHGMHTPKEWLRKNFELMKKANVNCIRTHYLAPPAVAELCDEMGFYLIQELPMDWFWNTCDVESLGPLLTRFEGGVRRDRNHVSIMIWGLGNENLAPDRKRQDVWWAHIGLLNRLVKTLDPHRFTILVPPGPANRVKGLLETRVGDIADTHYSLKFVRELNETGSMEQPCSWEGPHGRVSRAEAVANGWSGVWLSTEYCLVNAVPDLLCAPYLSIICDRPEDPLSGRNTQQVFLDRLAREWGYMRDDPSCLGGAFFPWLCCGAGDPWGWTLFGEDADWGVVTSDLTPKSVFWVLRVLFSPVQFPVTRIEWEPGQTDFVFPVHNGYNSINLSECTFRTMLGGGPPFMGQMRDWKDVAVAAAPGETAEIRVPIWHPPTLAALQAGAPVVCRCVVLDPTGFRPITADIVVVPAQGASSADAPVPVGPDAVL